MKPCLLALLVLWGSTLLAQSPANSGCGPDIAMPESLTFLRNLDFEASVPEMATSLAALYVGETRRLREIFLEHPSYQYFFNGAIPIGTCYRDILTRVREGRNDLGGRLARIATKLEKKRTGLEREHRQRRDRDPQIPLRIQALKKAEVHFQSMADAFTVKPGGTTNGGHFHDFNDIQQTIETYGHVRWEEGAPSQAAAALNERIRKVYSTWGEIRAALIVPNLRAMNVIIGRYGRTGDFISSQTLRKLSVDDATYEIDLVFRDEQNRVCWGEVKTFFAVLDSSGHQWERVKDSLAKHKRISQAMGFSVQRHLFLINGIRAPERAMLEADGVTVWGATVP